MDAKNLPETFRGQVVAVLRTRDTEIALLLIPRLREYRDSLRRYVETAQHLIREYDAPGKRDGRHNVLQSVRDSVEYCLRAEKSIEAALKALDLLSKT
jgi:hypothetical protein